MRFRCQLVAPGLDRSLFAAIARDLESKGASVRKGTLIDATIIGSASKGDKEAAWVRHRTRAPAYGYKADIAADMDSGIIRDVAITPANEPDVAIAPSIIPDKPGEVYADKAYDALSIEEAIKAKGGTASLLRKGHRWLSAEKLEAHNRPLRPIRASVAGLSTNSFFIASREGICLETPCSLARIEKIFVTWKPSYHFRPMRWIGLVKARLQVHLAAIAYTSNDIGGCKAPERI